MTLQALAEVKGHKDPSHTVEPSGLRCPVRDMQKMTRVSRLKTGPRGIEGLSFLSPGLHGVCSSLRLPDTHSLCQAALLGLES